MDRRLAWLDIAKGMGIVLVVYGHAFRGLVTIGLERLASPLGTVDYAIYSFHMPLFFFISGLLARHSFDKGAMRYWSAKLRYLVYPYLLWSLLQGGMQMGFAPVANHHVSFAELLRVLWSPLQQFWFLYVLFWCLAALAVLHPLSNRLLLALAACLFVTTFFIDLGIASTVMWAFFYVALGAALAEPVQRFQPSASLTALLWLAFFAITLGGLGLKLGSGAAVPAALCGIAGTLALSRRLRWGAELLRVLGYLSMSIYLMHVIATALARNALVQLIHVDNIAVLLLATTVAGLALPVLAHVLLSRAGLLQWFGLSNELQLRPLRSPSLPTRPDAAHRRPGV